MDKINSNQPGSKKIKGVKRKAINLSEYRLINPQYFDADKKLPLVIKGTVGKLNLIDWARENHSFIEENLCQHGGILFRGFQVKGVAEFEQFIQSVSETLLDYTYRSTPRSPVFGKIQTSTEYPAHQVIPLHNEMAYCHNWPLKICFFCVQAAENGGETPIADSRKVLQRLNPKIVEKFEEKKVMYVRNYGEGLDLSWQTVFQTNDPLAVEKYCDRAGITFEWKPGNRLRTQQICQGVATHPKTKEKVWFNQAHLFHISNLVPEVQRFFLAEYGETKLPRNAYYGDGSPIESSFLDEIRSVYQQERIVFPWQSGDILMLDNMQVAHGRNPYKGQRKVLVGMADNYARERE
ncbi:TauD/TfdA family dioxygenase [Oscillatoria salina IIICB1]|nr:TauD/TfdA family dioxygenase [Oscillatoria salina IIICB1]